MTNRRDWQTSVSVALGAFNRERLEDLAKNQIRCIELTDGNLEHYNSYKQNAKGFFALAAEHSVKIRSVHLPFVPFNLIDPASTTPSVRNNFLEKQSEILKLSADCGAEIAVVHPSGEPYSEETRGENLKLAIDSISRLNEVAKASGIKLAVENLPRTCICRDCREIEAFAAAVPEVSFVFDSNHSLIDSNAQVIKAMGSRIVALHISDYEFIDEMHLLPGCGKVNWDEIMTCLEQVGYSGTWNYEIRNSADLPAKTFRENHLKLLRAL